MARIWAGIKRRGISGERSYGARQFKCSEVLAIVFGVVQPRTDSIGPLFAVVARRAGRLARADETDLGVRSVDQMALSTCDVFMDACDSGRVPMVCAAAKVA